MWLTVVAPAAGIAQQSAPHSRKSTADGLCAQGRALAAYFDSRKQPLPPPIRARLMKAIEKGRNSEVDSILSGVALLEIHINPESRVKVTRGRAGAELKQGEETLMLVRISNESGVTGPLRCFVPLRAIRSTQIRPPMWLAARVVPIQGPSAEPRLNGVPIEYAVLGFTTREIGLREAALVFDVGQGTQDLGFRGELPVLFRCVRPKSGARLAPQ